MCSWDHLSYGITQCYLPPDRGDSHAFTPAYAGTHLSTPEGWKAEFTSVAGYTKMVYPYTVTHPSINWARRRDQRATTKPGHHLGYYRVNDHWFFIPVCMPHLWNVDCSFLWTCPSFWHTRISLTIQELTAHYSQQDHFCSTVASRMLCTLLQFVKPAIVVSFCAFLCNYYVSIHPLTTNYKLMYASNMHSVIHWSVLLKFLCSLTANSA